MKTNGLTHARAAKGIILPLLAFITTVPVLSQVNFASLKNTSFTSQSKKFAAGSQDYYAVLEPATRQFYSASEPFFTPSSGKGGGEEITNDNPRDAKNDLLLTENNKERNRENLDISFKPTAFNYPANSRVDVGISQFPSSQLILYAIALKQYAKKNGFDTSYAFLSNMGMLCNKKRFFVVNLATMEIEQSALVSHGRGQGPSVFDKQYSNRSGSKCTSLGRYKISGKYKGGYGESYKMVGLDSSNKNAYSRNIVLHSMGCIPDIDGIMPACVSEGCPAVSTKFLSSLRKIIDTRKKPVLMWIFDSNLEQAVFEERPVKNKPGPGYPIVNENHTCSLHHFNQALSNQY
jgi:hypothetical protein